MLIVGLTGGIGSGKTTVSDFFAALGVPIIDTDLIARKLVEPGTPAYEEIKTRYGHCIIQNNKLDRTKLRQVIFTDASEKKWLENLLHPLILSEMRHQIQRANYPYCVAVIPLLIEKNLMGEVDRILVLDATSDLRLKRVSQRDSVTEGEVLKIFDRQSDRDTLLKYADDIIENNNDLDQLKQKVANLHQKYMEIAQEKSV